MQSIPTNAPASINNQPGRLAHAAAKRRVRLASRHDKNAATNMRLRAVPNQSPLSRVAANQLAPNSPA